MNKSIKVKKFNGELVPFEKEKLIASLMHSKAGLPLATEIADEIEGHLFDGAPTDKIYQYAFKLLRKRRRASAARYKIKKAIMQMGPSGYPFEHFISHIFQHDGYTCEVGVLMDGNCVKHEVDVLARKPGLCYLVECKFHNGQGKANDVKIPLYIHSRFNDLVRKMSVTEPDTKFVGWIFTNTRFTSDAIDYARCNDLRLVSWNYPPERCLKDRITQSGLFPITVMTTLTKKEKDKLLAEGIVLCRELQEQFSILQKFGFAKNKLARVQEELDDLCN